jgi:hypothetical protein
MELEDVALNARSFAVLGQAGEGFWGPVSARLAAQPPEAFSDRALQMLYPVVTAHAPAGALAALGEAGAQAGGGGGALQAAAGSGGGGGTGSRSSRGSIDSSESFVPQNAFETMLEGIAEPVGPLAFVSQQAQQQAQQQQQQAQQQQQQQAQQAQAQQQQQQQQEQQQQAEEPAPARKRGRPRKGEAAAAGVAQPTPGAGSAALEAPAPRKRGRPKKQPQQQPGGSSPAGLQLPEALQRACRAAWQRGGGANVSDLQQQVAAVLRELGLQVEMEHMDPACLLSLDIVVTLPSGARVAVEVDGPEHFTRNRPHRCARAPAGRLAASPRAAQAQPPAAAAFAHQPLRPPCASRAQAQRALPAARPDPGQVRLAGGERALLRVEPAGRRRKEARVHARAAGRGGGAGGGGGGGQAVAAGPMLSMGRCDPVIPILFLPALATFTAVARAPGGAGSRPYRRARLC